MQSLQTPGRQSMTHGSSAEAESFELSQRYDTVLRARTSLDCLVRTSRSRLRPYFVRNLDVSVSVGLTGGHGRMVAG
jgi:hypothetical protein